RKATTRSAGPTSWNRPTKWPAGPWSGPILRLPTSRCMCAMIRRLCACRWQRNEMVAEVTLLPFLPRPHSIDAHDPLVLAVGYEDCSKRLGSDLTEYIVLQAALNRVAFLYLPGVPIQYSLLDHDVF